MTLSEESAIATAAKARHDSIRLAYNRLTPPVFGASAEVVAKHAAALRELADVLCPVVEAESPSTAPAPASPKRR